MVSKFNIKKNLEEKPSENTETNVEENTQNLPNHHFSQADLDKIWKEFLDKTRSDIVVYSAINGFTLTKIDEHSVEIKYPSESSKDKFSKVEFDFVNTLKHKTQNYTISVVYTLDFTLKQEVETQKSIFEKFAEINPLLRDLDQLVKFEFN